MTHKKETMVKDSTLAICPYCNTNLDKTPKRKKKCPSCNNYIHVRRTLDENKPILVTEEKAKQLDEERIKSNANESLLRTIQHYGFTEEEFKQRRKESYEKNKYIMNVNDVIWSLFQSRVHDLIKEGNHGTASGVYFQMALFLASEESKRPQHTLEASSRSRLLDYKASGCKKVEIIPAGNGCEHCNNLKGKVYDIEEALETMPLPNKDCTFDMHENGQYFCRCIYVAASEDLDEISLDEKKEPNLTSSKSTKGIDFDQLILGLLILLVFLLFIYLSLV